MLTHLQYTAEPKIGICPISTVISCMAATWRRGLCMMPLCDGNRSTDLRTTPRTPRTPLRKQITTHACMRDPTLTVDIPKSPMQFLPLTVAPQGNPASYKDLPTPSGEPFQIVPPDLSGPCEGTCTAFLRASSGAEAGMQLLLVTVWAGGEQVGLLFGCSEEWFAAERSVEERLKALQAAYANVPSVWLQECAEAMASGSQRARTVSFVTCSKLGSGRAVLLGDAAHALSPNVAAGCNAALQDAAVLADSIQAVGRDLDRVADQFTADRLHDVQAITRISRQIDDVLCYGFHGDLQRTLRGVPITTTLILSALPAESAWPSFLRPPGSFTSMMQTSKSFSKVDADAQQLFQRLMAALAAPLLLLGAAAMAALT
eukprot:jgi/Ulvmu1/11453/UM076_0028.1